MNNYVSPWCYSVDIISKNESAIFFNTSETTNQALVKEVLEWEEEEDIAREPEPLPEFRNVWKEVW